MHQNAGTISSRQEGTIMPSEEEFRELDLLLGDARNENRILRHRLDKALDEAVRLRQALEGILALSYQSIYPSQSEGAGEGPPNVGEAATEVGAD
jgi:hypothetical protein